MLDWRVECFTERSEWNERKRKWKKECSWKETKVTSFFISMCWSVIFTIKIIYKCNIMYYYSILWFNLFVHIICNLCCVHYLFYVNMLLLFPRCVLQDIWVIWASIRSMMYSSISFHFYHIESRRNLFWRIRWRRVSYKW